MECKVKTIIARFTEINKLTEDQRELLGDDYNFNNIEKALKSVGIQTKDSAGQMKSFSQILNELGPMWNSLTNNQQRYIATQAAGSRQQSRFIALMSDWERTQELQGIAEDSAGTGAEQLARSLDSIETKLNKLKASWEVFYNNFLKSSFFKGLIDALNGILSLINDISASFGALGPTVILAMGLIIAKLIKKAISWGKAFGEGFMASYQSTMNKFNAAKDSKDAKRVKKEYRKGYAEGQAHSKGYKDGYEGREKSEKGLDLLRDINNDTGGKGGKLGGKLGNFLGNIKGFGSAAKTGAGGFFTALKSGKGLGGAFKTAKIGGMHAAVKGGLGAGATKAAGVAAAALPPVAIAAAAAAIAAGTVKIVDAVNSHYEKKSAQNVANSNSEITKTTEKITKASTAYAKAAKLQSLGLSKTTEQQEEYQKSLKELQQTYPHLIKTLSDGTLELIENAQQGMSDALEKEREYIRKNNEILSKSASSVYAIGGGAVLTEEGQQTQEAIKNAAANLGDKSNDYLKQIMGTSGHVKASNFSEISEKGLNRESLNKALGNQWYNPFSKDAYFNTAAEYEEYLQSIVNGTASTASDAYKVINELARESGMSIAEYAQQALDEASPETIKNTEAANLAKSYASEYGVNYDKNLSSGFGQLYGEDKESAEKAMRRYYRDLSDSQRSEIERFIDTTENELKIGDISGDQAEQIAARLTGGDKDLTEAVEKALQDAIEKRDEILKGEDGKSGVFGALIDAGIGASNDELAQEYADFSVNQIVAIKDQVVQVSQDYGKEAAKVFGDQYTNFLRSYNLDSAIDLRNIQDIAKQATELKIKFGETSTVYKDFMNLVNSSGPVLERDFKNYSEIIQQAKSDVEGLKKDFDLLTKAVEGNLDVGDMFDLVANYGEVLKIEDFTATGSGYLLNQEKAKKLEKDMLEYRKFNYQLQLSQYKLSAIQLETNIQNSVLELEKDKEKSKTFGTQIELLKNINLEEYTRLQLLAAQNALSGDELDSWNEISTAVAKLGLADEFNSYVELQQKTIPGLESVIKLFDELNLEQDRTVEGIERINSSLEKAISLLEQIQKYADLEAFVEKLNQQMTKEDWKIEFSTNIDVITEATKEKLADLMTSYNASLAKMRGAEEGAGIIRKDLENRFKKYVSFDKSGNIMMNDKEIMAWAQKIQKLSASANENDKKRAEDEEKIYNQLFKQIDAYREEDKLIKEAENEAGNLLKQQKELLKLQKENIKGLEDKLFEAIQARDQKIVDDLEKRYETMKEMDSKYLESVRKAVEDERALRDKDKSYEDLQKQEKKLQLLKISGGSATQIQQLEQEVSEKRQELADKEIDDLLDELEEENENRAEKMDEEVEYEKAKLEEKIRNRVQYNAEIMKLMQSDSTTIINFLKQNDEEFKSSTDTARDLWIADMDKLINGAKSSMDTLADTSVQKMQTALEKLAENTQLNVTDMNTYSSTVTTVAGTVIPKIGEIKNSYVGVKETLEKIIDLQKQVKPTAIPSKKTEDPPKKQEDPPKAGDKITVTTADKKIVKLQSQLDALGIIGYDEFGEGRAAGMSRDEYLKYLSSVLSSKSFNTGMARTGQYTTAKIKGIRLKNGGYYLVLDNGSEFYASTMGLDGKFLYESGLLPKFATGGLVNFTGPAWVDGTPSKPEAFLSANDTALISDFINVFRTSISSPQLASSSQNAGDTYYEIHINVDELGDGYSVDDLMEEIEDHILTASNTNSVIKLTR